MASLLKKVTKAAKTLTNPVTAVNPVATTKAALSITPVNTTSATRVAAALVNPNPVSSDKMALTRAAMNPNPLEAAKQTLSVVSSTVNPTTTTTAKKVVPNRSSYSAAASSTESERAKIMAQRLTEQGQKVPGYTKIGKVVPDRSGYAASEGAKANAAEYYKAANVNALNLDRFKEIVDEFNQASKAAAESAGIKPALDNDNPNTAAAVADELRYTNPEQVRIIYEGANAARGAAAMEQQQQLPEVVVESDYKKYFILGGSLLLAVVLWKKLK